MQDWSVPCCLPLRRILQWWRTPAASQHTVSEIGGVYHHVYNLLSWLVAQPAKSEPGSEERVCAVGCSMTLGIIILALSHRGNPLLSPCDHPYRRRVVCHPVPIDSTTGSGLLFLGLTHPQLLPRPICVTPARRQLIWLYFPDGISSDITFGIPRSSRGGPFLLLLDARCVHRRSAESSPSAPRTPTERGPLITS